MGTTRLDDSSRTDGVPLNVQDAPEVLVSTTYPNSEARLTGSSGSPGTFLLSHRFRTAVTWRARQVGPTAAGGGADEGWKSASFAGAFTHGIEPSGLRLTGGITRAGLV